MSLRKCFAQQNLELSLFFAYCFLGRKELLFVKTYLFPNCNAVRSEYQNVVQNSQKGTWSKTPAYSYACTVHELKGKPSSFLFYFAGQPQDPRVPVVLHRMWWIGKCWELWITQGGIFRTIPVGGRVLSCICLIGMCRPAQKGRGFTPFWSENGYRLCLFWSEFGYGFRGNAWTYMSSQFQMNKKERVICEFEVDFKKSFCWRSNQSTVNSRLADTPL